MTPEKPTQSIAGNHYSTPNDQFSTELWLIDVYEQQFPESAPLLHKALDEVKRFAGIPTPNYLTEIDNPKLSGIGSVQGGGGLAKLVLRMPKEPSPTELHAMSEAERQQAFFDQDGNTILGDVPPETAALLSGLYSLVGAKEARKDTWTDDEGIKNTQIIRQGEYLGTPVYFLESQIMGDAELGGQPQLNVYMLGREAAQEELHKPTPAQEQEFIEKTGIDPMKYSGALVLYNLTQDNYLQVADVLNQTRQIVDGFELDSK